MHQAASEGVRDPSMPPALPPRPPPRPLGSVSLLHIEPAVTVVTTSPPTPGHYEPPPDHVHHNPGGATVAQVVQAPALPAPNASTYHATTTRTQHQCWSSALRKYVILCTACGGMAALLGALFLLVHFVLRAHTSSLHYFETVPTYVPATMLTLTGLAVMCFARRKNRYSYLIKVCGICCLLSAVLCVIVTVTTTVIHMNRLQTLRECVYTQKNQACTCYSGLTQETSEESMRFVFHNTPDCEVVHGALYSCLRALFGLSVIGILVCIFSCMLVYQLLSHEKKKMYWEQLEMRCRYLYGQRPASGQHQYTYCGCSCDDCPRAAAAANTAVAPHAEMFHPWPAWQWDAAEERYWTPPRVGNLYTPNPEDQVQHQQQQIQEANASGSARWSWLPWNRASLHVENAEVEQQRPLRTDQDSQYGFGVTTRPTTTTATIIQTPRGQMTSTVVRPLSAQAFMTDASSGLPRYMWGPPPPYSQPPSTAGNSAANSPARAAPALPPADQTSNICFARHQHMMHAAAPAALHHHHHHHCEQQIAASASSPQHLPVVSPLQSPVIAARHSNHSSSPYCARLRAENVQAIKSLADLPNPASTVANSLPSRKIKKKPADPPISKVDSQDSEVSSALSPTDSPSRKGLASSLRGLFGAMPGSPVLVHPANRSLPQSAPPSAINSPLKAAGISVLRRHCVEAMKAPEPAESEVYFADVSSCNGGPDSSVYDEANLESQSHYSSIPSPGRPRFMAAERLAPDAQYEGQQGDDDAPLRDSDATIDSGVHSGSEAALQSRLRPALRPVDQLMTTRSVNV